MSEPDPDISPAEPGGPPSKEKETDPRLRRSVSRRSFITDELSRSAVQMARSLPSLAPILGIAMRESASRRDERLIRRLWELLVNREPKTHETAAGLDLMRKAASPDEKADALVDVMWALCQTEEFVNVGRSNEVLVRGFYQIALNREPEEPEMQAALTVITEAEETDARVAALEGLFTGLARSYESVLRKGQAGR